VSVCITCTCTDITNVNTNMREIFIQQIKYGELILYKSVDIPIQPIYI